MRNRFNIAISFRIFQDECVKGGMVELRKRTICAFIIIALVSGLVLFTATNNYSPEPTPLMSPEPKSPFIPYNNVTVESGKSLLDLVPIRLSGYSGVIMEMHLQSMDKLQLLQNTLMFQQNSWVATDSISYFIQNVLSFSIAANDQVTGKCITSLWEQSSTRRILIEGTKTSSFYLPDTPYDVTLLTYIGADGYPHSVVKVNNGLLLNHTEKVAGSFSGSAIFSSTNQFSITGSYDSSICPEVSGFFTINKYLNGAWSNPSLLLLEKQNTQSDSFSEVIAFAITGNRVNFSPAQTVPSAYTGVSYS